MRNGHGKSVDSESYATGHRDRRQNYGQNRRQRCGRRHRHDRRQSRREHRHSHRYRDQSCGTQAGGTMPFRVRTMAKTSTLQVCDCRASGAAEKKSMNTTG